MGGNYIEVQHFEKWKLLEIMWPIRRGNAYIFIVYYRTINQKDKLLYIDMEKNMSFSLSTETEIQNNCNIKFRYNLYGICTRIGMQHWHVHIYSFCTFKSSMNKFNYD